jgi:hypothetical protein
LLIASSRSPDTPQELRNIIRHLVVPSVMRQIVNLHAHFYDWATAAMGTNASEQNKER